MGHEDQQFTRHRHQDLANVDHQITRAGNQWRSQCWAEGSGHGRPGSITSSWKVIKTVHLAADDKRQVLHPRHYLRKRSVSATNGHGPQTGPTGCLNLCRTMCIVKEVSGWHMSDECAHQYHLCELRPPSCAARRFARNA